MAWKYFGSHRPKKKWKLEHTSANSKDAKAYAQEANYIVNKGLGWPMSPRKGDYVYRYKAVGNKVYIKYTGRRK